MAVAVTVHSKQTEDADRGAYRALYSLFVGYGLAGISLEASRFDLSHNLFETASVRLEPNTAALVEPITVSFSLVPTGEASFSESPIRDNYFISYIRGQEPVNWYSGEGEGNFVWPFRPTIADPDHLPIEIEQRLRHLASLQTNWDSYGASPVGRVALEKTRKLLLRLYSLNLPALPAAFIAPDPEGGIGIEWDFGLGREVLLTISAEGQLTYVLDMGRKRGEQEQLSADDLNDIEQILRVAAR